MLSRVHTVAGLTKLDSTSCCNQSSMTLIPNRSNGWTEEEKTLTAELSKFKVKQKLDACLHQLSITTCWNSCVNFYFGRWNCYNFLGSRAGWANCQREKYDLKKRSCGYFCVLPRICSWYTVWCNSPWWSSPCSDQHNWEVQAKVAQAKEGLHSRFWHGLCKTPKCILALSKVAGNVKKNSNARPMDFGLVWMTKSRFTGSTQVQKTEPQT
jgi:hypothetical protein